MPSKEQGRSPIQRIEDVLENIDAIGGFVAGIDLSGFLADRRTIYADTRALEIISEASRHLPDDLKQRHPELDWRGIAAVGNLYRHAYDGVDNTYVWNVVAADLAPLKAALSAELQRLDRHDPLS